MSLHADLVARPGILFIARNDAIGRWFRAFTKQEFEFFGLIIPGSPTQSPGIIGVWLPFGRVEEQSLSDILHDQTIKRISVRSLIPADTQEKTIKRETNLRLAFVRYIGQRDFKLLTEYEVINELLGRRINHGVFEVLGELSSTIGFKIVEGCRSFTALEELCSKYSVSTPEKITIPKKLIPNRSPLDRTNFPPQGSSLGIGKRSQCSMTITEFSQDSLTKTDVNQYFDSVSNQGDPEIRIRAIESLLSGIFPRSRAADLMTTYVQGSHDAFAPIKRFVLSNTPDETETMDGEILKWNEFEKQQPVINVLMTTLINEVLSDGELAMLTSESMTPEINLRSISQRLIDSRLESETDNNNTIDIESSSKYVETQISKASNELYEWVTNVFSNISSGHIPVVNLFPLFSIHQQLSAEKYSIPQSAIVSALIGSGVELDLQPENQTLKEIAVTSDGHGISLLTNVEIHQLDTCLSKMDNIRYQKLRVQLAQELAIRLNTFQTKK